MRSNQDKALEVWLDSDLAPACLVGTLAHDRGQVRLRYNRNWLGQARAFALDPDLSLDEQPFFPKPELGNFGVFLDSSPDRWGQTLMKRREALHRGFLRLTRKQDNRAMQTSLASQLPSIAALCERYGVAHLRDLVPVAGLNWPNHWKNCLAARSIW